MIGQMKNISAYVVLILILSSCQNENDRDYLFTSLDQEQTGISFNNTIPDSSTFNILTYEYIYNGGGVAISDFDNDGLKDVFFTGNMVDNKLYQNKGSFQFEDISNSAKVEAQGSWCSGIAVVDINLDGYKDLYICTNTADKGSDRQNLLYINQYAVTGALEFKESAQEYGIADTSYSVNSAFLDYDNDGDLDLFIINNHMSESRNPTTYSFQKKEITSERVDRLYRNDWSEELGHPVYTDVSKEAGIKVLGYSLGLNITDINRDGWKDIYVSNDFLSNDILYINNQDGTFTDKSFDYLKHTSHSAMGNDVVDINNDGLMDIIAVDMLPESNYRKKTMMGSTNYTSFLYMERFNYMQQYVRNTLQVNQGMDPSGDLVFSDYALLSGIDATDWSWAPVVADFDRDGLKDILITNGFPKDITDRDFMDYRANNHAFIEKDKMLRNVPEVKISNYAYKNLGDGQFADVTNQWGMFTPSFSNGAAYGDLDNDGDLDVVVNNINDRALIYQNNSVDGQYLKIKLQGPTANPDAFGAIVKYNSQELSGIYEHTTSRGYLSNHDEEIFIGLGQDTTVNIEVIWPDGQILKERQYDTNQAIVISYEEDQTIIASSDNDKDPMFIAIDIVPNEAIKDLDYNDYNIEPLLLHKYSQLGPGISVCDVNADRRDDYYVSGSTQYNGVLMIQSANGTFKQSNLLDQIDPSKEELSSLWFDADGDGDQDVYIVCGGNQFNKSDERYRDVLLMNQNGQFVDVSEVLDLPLISSGTVRGADFDRDGDIDLFVGGRVVPGEFPTPSSSFLLRNNSDGDVIDFEIINASVAPDLNDIGLVSDALWTDYDQDGWVDLIIAGEWMPITVLRNVNGNLERIESSGLDQNVGFWNSLSGADYDGDGDIDYIAGNYGLNSTVKFNKEHPIRIYNDDFDNNGSSDAIPFVYFKDIDGVYNEFSYHGRGDLAKELNRVRKKFSSNEMLARAPMDSILTLSEQEQAYKLEANYSQSSYIRNDGNGKFTMVALPIEAQTAPIFGILSNDYTGDGHLDILLVGNDFGAQPNIGRMDAMNGLLLIGNGKGEFESAKVKESGFYVPGDAKSLVQINVGEEQVIIASQNDERLKSFGRYKSTLSANQLKTNQSDQNLSFYNEQGALIRFSEVYLGQGYLSQSTEHIQVPDGVVKAVITAFDGTQRELIF